MAPSVTPSVSYRFSAFPGLPTDLVPWRDGLFLPRRWEVEVDDESVPYLVDLVLAVEDGSPGIDSVRQRRRPGVPLLTSRIVRKVRVGEYLQAATVLRAVRLEQNPDGSWAMEPAHSGGTFDVIPEHSRSRRMSPSHLQAVAAIYNAAVAAGSRAPRKAVQDDPRWRPVPTNTAARWVRAARDAGLIPQDPAQPTKATKATSKKGAK